jgi:hypothetical protein
MLRWSSLALVLLTACSSNGSASAPAPPTVDTTPTEPATRDVPDAAPACASPCGYAPQCGCGAGTCDLVDETNARACVLGGEIRAGGSCTSTSFCAQGLVCAHGVCRVPCATVGAACAGGGTCTMYLGASADAGTQLADKPACSIP